MAKEIINSGVDHNVLANGTKIKGIISTESDFRVDGEIEGDVICNGKIVIGTLGTLKGNLTCTNAEIMGKVNGKIVTSEVTSLKSTAKIFGELKTKILIIEPEAIFSGTCDMGQDKDSEKPAVTLKKN
ncbi:MAG: polymer-forming cytoskeletal protein [Sphingobacteriia bacterium]|nr:polymer-forming cytoskeletal protein [Paludibacteraceae bacterium]NCA78839.1 polymer-forming cytoskeletal protein [Sphingobacteriia bacterium]